MQDFNKRQQTLDISKSFIIQAPAGSGKTDLLAKRYLKLLAYVNNPSAVLAITFTKKAAAEIRQRIIENLKNCHKKTTDKNKQLLYDICKEVLVNSNKHNWYILKQPFLLKIMTFDSLNRYILQLKKTNLDTLDILEDKTIYKKAAWQTIKTLDDDYYKDYHQSITNVLNTFSLNYTKVVKLLEDMLLKREQWLPYVDMDASQYQQYLNLTLKKISQNYLEKLATLDVSIIFSILKKPKTIMQWQYLAHSILTKKGDFKKTFSDLDLIQEQKQELKDILHTPNIGILKLKQILREILYLPYINISIINGKDNFNLDIFVDFLRILKLAAAHLKILFNKIKKNDFIETGFNALDSFDENTIDENILYLGQNIQHILIDEFQDTSRQQFILLENIIKNWQIDEHRTVFIIGDPMQSIYGFRLAEVSIFLQVIKKGILHIKPKFIELDRNFRTDKNLVRSVGELITNNLINFEDIKYKKSYSDITLKDADFKAVDTKNIERSQYIINLIKELSNKHKNYNIAVLANNRLELIPIIDKLNKQNIIFNSKNIYSLNKQWLISDLLSLLKALKNKDDKISWLSILRAPWCGLLLDDLLLISEENKHKLVWQTINDKNIQAKFSNCSRKRIKHFIDALLPAISEQGSFYWSYIMFITCTRLGLDSYLEQYEMGIKQSFFDLLFKMEKDQVDVDIEVLEHKLNNLYQPTITSSNINLMTVHAAKGLEFDIVIIPNLDAKLIPKKINPFLIYTSFFNELLLSPMYDRKNNDWYTYISMVVDKKNILEKYRQLYVAMTRAKNMLYLIYDSNNIKECSNKPILDYKRYIDFLDIVKLEKNTIEINNQTNINDQKDQKIYSKKLIRLKELPKITKYQKKEKITTAKIKLDNYYHSLFGKVVHLYLELVGNIYKQDFAYLLLKQFGFTENNFKIAKQNITKIITNVANDNKNKWIFDNKLDSKNELEIFINNKQIEKIIIDKLIVVADVVWIIDFKTDNLNKNNQKELIEKYQDKMTTYKNAVANLSQYKNKVIKKALYFVSVPLLVEI